MLVLWARRLVVLLLILNGVLFTSNTYVLGDPEAAIAMHDDLAPDTAPLVVELKVLVTFATGLLYLLAATGLYLYELAAWGGRLPPVWANFAVFGGLALVFAGFGYREWRPPAGAGIGGPEQPA